MIANKLRGQGRSQTCTKPTPGDQKHIWAKNQLTEARTVTHTHRGLKTSLASYDWQWLKRRSETNLQAMKTKPHERSDARSWKTYQSRFLKPSIAQAAPLTQKATRRAHAAEKKKQRAHQRQIRIGKIGLADFLHRRRVLESLSPACPCGWHSQTPKHVIMFCSLLGGGALMLREAGTNSYRLLTESSTLLKWLTASVMKWGLLGQFSPAVQLLSTVASFLFSFSHRSHCPGTLSHASPDRRTVGYRDTQFLFLERFPM